MTYGLRLAASFLLLAVVLDDGRVDQEHLLEVREAGVLALEVGVQLVDEGLARVLDAGQDGQDGNLVDDDLLLERLVLVQEGQDGVERIIGAGVDDRLDNGQTTRETSIV